jgi:hypothetical protein
VTKETEIAANGNDDVVENACTFTTCAPGVFHAVTAARELKLQKYGAVKSKKETLSTIKRMREIVTPTGGVTDAVNVTLAGRVETLTTSRL